MKVEFPVSDPVNPYSPDSSNSQAPYGQQPTYGQQPA